MNWSYVTLPCRFIFDIELYYIILYSIKSILNIPQDFINTLKFKYYLQDVSRNAEQSSITTI